MPKLRYYHEGEWIDIGGDAFETTNIRGTLGITHWEELDGLGVTEGDVRPGIIGEQLYFQVFLRIPEYPDTVFLEVTQTGTGPPPDEAWTLTRLDEGPTHLYVSRLSIEWEDTENTPRWMGNFLNGDPFSFSNNIVQGHTGSAIPAGRRTQDTSSWLLPSKVIGTGFIGPWCGVYDPGGPNHQMSSSWTQFEIIDVGPCENMWSTWFS